MSRASLTVLFCHGSAIEIRERKMDEREPNQTRNGAETEEGSEIVCSFRCCEGRKKKGRYNDKYTSRNVHLTDDRSRPSSIVFFNADNLVFPEACNGTLENIGRGVEHIRKRIILPAR